MTQPPSGPPQPPYGGRSGNPPSGGGPGSPPLGPGPGSAAPGPAPQNEQPNLINGATTHGILGQKAIRHPWELPLLGVGIATTILGYIGWFTFLLVLLVRWINNGAAAAGQVMTVASGLPFVAQLIVLLPLVPLIYWWIRAIGYARSRATSVRMSPSQFPEGYRMVAEAAQHYGLRKVPDAYVELGNGTINAFASGHGFRRTVVVTSDMFEIGGSARDPEALRFVIGHEVGHLAAGHVSYFRLVFTTVISTIPLLGPAFSRSQEYTADNFGYTFCPAGAPGIVAVLTGGKYLNADVNFHELADRAATDPSFFVHWVNVQSSHPVPTWRAHALRDRTKPGSLWIRPSGALFTSPLPPGSVFSSRYPTPQQALAMLSAADAIRPAGTADQWGRFPGADYQGRPPARQVQTAPPVLGQRTSYTIPPGPYRDDARGQDGPPSGGFGGPQQPGGPKSPSGPVGPTGYQSPPLPPRG